MESEINLQELVRNELLDKPIKATNERSFLAGILRGGGELTFLREGFGLTVTLFCEKTMQFFLEMVKSRYDSAAKIATLSRKVAGRVLTYQQAVFEPYDSGRILADCKVITDKYSFAEGLPEELLKKKSDKKAFLIGIFLSCGSLYAPQGKIGDRIPKSKNQGYHLEFSLKSASVINDFTNLLNELCEYEQGVAKIRKGGYSVYIKSAEKISDCLAAMGANKGVLKLQAIVASRDMHNRLNRGMNFIMANIDRTTEASETQIKKIQPLYESGTLKDPKLIEIAELRMRYAELSLEQLAELTSPPVTKSAINHRLRKLVRLADEFLGGI